MKTLIIILIVVLIAQTCVFIYAHFIDIANNRLAAASQQMVASAQEAFLSEKKRMQEAIDNRDKTINEWVKKYEHLFRQYSYLMELYNKKESKPHYCPTVEQIKSVYAAAGVMEQVNEHTDAVNLMELWEGLKDWHKQNGGNDITFEEPQKQ